METKDKELLDNEYDMLNKHAEENKLRKHEEERRRIKRYTSKLWIWLGVLILILILLYWIFFIGIDLGVNQ